MSMPRFPLYLLPLFLLATACPTTGGDDDDAADDDDDAVPSSFQDMSREQRGTYMEDVVLPEMQALFTEFAPFYPELECETCHGADFDTEDVNFVMPNGLIGLPFTGFPFSEGPSPRIASWGAFMEDEVLPKMVELLDEQPFDAGTGEGFGCFGCHENYSEPDSWQELENPVDKRAYMNWTVFPPLAEAFKGFDSTEYAAFDCETCHGDDMWAAEFEMPNGNVELPFSGFPFSESADPEEAAYGEFMEDEVVPAMLDLLDAEPFDPQTGEGFGCFACHEMPGN